MKIGISFSGITDNNGADYVAEFLANAVLRTNGHQLVMIGAMGKPQAKDIPDGLDVVIHSSGFGLTPELVEKWKKKTKVFVWSHNDEIPLFQNRLGKITMLVDQHFSYTRQHPFGPHVRYLPLAADHTIYRPLEDVEKKYDISMIGAGHPWRTKFVEKISKYFPNNYFDFTMRLTHEEVNLLYNRTKLVIAPMQDCDQYNSEAVFGCPCRTFDVPASGTLQLQAYRKGLHDIHSLDLLKVTTLPSIRDVDLSMDMWTSTIGMLLNDKSARELAGEAHQQIMDKHLYIHRLEEILQFV